jgi:hydroxyethylthiazole kinase-like sugar kinase family protein
MNVRRLHERKRRVALVLRSAPIIEITLASGCLNASTCAVFLAPRITHATRGVPKRVDNAVVTVHAISHVGNLALRVWNRVSGFVLIIHVRWCVDR